MRNGGSEYLRRFGERGPGKPKATIEVLPGVGDGLERARARRRAVALLVEENRERFASLYRNELVAIVDGDGGGS